MLKRLAGLLCASVLLGSTQTFDCVPPWATNVNCQFNGDTGCATSADCAAGWTRWSNFTCTYEDPYCGDGGCISSCTATVYQCDTLCSPGFTSARWQFDPVKMVLGLFPRLHTEWLPRGPHGECRRVKS